jgi:oxygen-independent coproporphyrinogen-3 oxidase
LNYWQFGDYIGIGAGAHGKITETINNKPTITRRWKYRQPQQYMDKALTGNALSGTQQLEQQDIVFEFLLNALRLKSGCEIKTFTQNTGLNKQYLLFAIKDIDPALLQMNDQRISTTGKGYAFLNNILESLLVDELFVPVMDH